MESDAMEAGAHLLGLPIELRSQILEELVQYPKFTTFRAVSLVNKQLHAEVQGVLLKEHAFIKINITAERAVVDDLLEKIAIARISKKPSENVFVRNFAHYHAELCMTMPRRSGTRKTQAMIITSKSDFGDDELVVFLQRVGTYGLPPLPETPLTWDLSKTRLRLRAYKVIFSPSTPFETLHEEYVLNQLKWWWWEFPQFSIMHATRTTLAASTQTSVANRKWISVKHFAQMSHQYITVLLPRVMKHHDRELDTALSSLHEAQYELESSFISEQGLQWLRTEEAATAIDETGPLALAPKHILWGTYHMCLANIHSELAEVHLRYAASPEHPGFVNRDFHLEYALIHCGRAHAAVDAFPAPAGHMLDTVAWSYCRQARAMEAKGYLPGARQSIRKALEYKHEKDIVAHAVRIEKAWREQQQRVDG